MELQSSRVRDCHPNLRRGTTASGAVKHWTNNHPAAHGLPGLQPSSKLAGRLHGPITSIDMALGSVYFEVSELSNSLSLLQTVIDLCGCLA